MPRKARSHWNVALATLRRGRRSLIQYGGKKSGVSLYVPMDTLEVLMKVAKGDLPKSALKEIRE